jgi:hypothetical protein
MLMSRASKIVNKRLRSYSLEQRDRRAEIAWWRAGALSVLRGSSAVAIGAIAIILMLSWQGECWAYIDPNAGGFLWQILAPLASIFLSFAFYCRKEIRKLVRTICDRRKKSAPNGAAHEVRQ